MVMEYAERVVPIRSKITYQIHVSYGSETGAVSMLVDPVIVRRIDCLTALNESDVDLLTSVERLSGVRMQIPANAELATDIRKAIEHNIRHLAVTASISFSVVGREEPKDLNGSNNLAEKVAPKGYISLQEHHDV